MNKLSMAGCALGVLCLVLAVRVRVCSLQGRCELLECPKELYHGLTVEEFRRSQAALGHHFQIGKNTARDLALRNENHTFMTCRGVAIATFFDGRLVEVTFFPRDQSEFEAIVKKRVGGDVSLPFYFECGAVKFRYAQDFQNNVYACWTNTGNEGARISNSD